MSSSRKNFSREKMRRKIICCRRFSREKVTVYTYIESIEEIIEENIEIK